MRRKGEKLKGQKTMETKTVAFEFQVCSDQEEEETFWFFYGFWPFRMMLHIKQRVALRQIHFSSGRYIALNSGAALALATKAIEVRL